MSYCVQEVLMAIELSDKLIPHGRGTTWQGGHSPNPAGQTLRKELELVHMQKRTLNK